MKRFIDIAFAGLGSLITAPLVAILAVLIWLEDGHIPLYRSERAEAHGGSFVMFKLRSMYVDADRTGVASTAKDDPRLTKVGRFIRAWKLDEIPQLWNVVRGDMSLVGPRPQFLAATSRYTAAEGEILTVAPGITDLASVVFADEGDILAGADNPDERYDEIIRPWKSRLAIVYVRHHSSMVDLYIILLTVIAIFYRGAALSGIEFLLKRWNVDDMVVRMASRRTQLLAYAPPTESESSLSKKTVSGRSS